MLENDCIAAAVLDVGHPAASDGGECLLPVGLYRDCHCHAGMVLDFAGSSEKAGMISCAKRRRLSREPPQLMITYSTPARRTASSLPMISSGVPIRLFASASSGA